MQIIVKKISNNKTEKIKKRKEWKNKLGSIEKKKLIE